jgi:hypothetical protein
MSYFSEKYEPYIPQTTGEIYDLLAAFIGDSPSFEDKTGDFPGMNIETEFHALYEGWKNVRKKLGEDDYARALAITARMKELFLADPKDVTGETHEGRKLVWQLEDIIRESNTRARKAKNG